MGFRNTSSFANGSIGAKFLDARNARAVAQGLAPAPLRAHGGRRVGPGPVRGPRSSGLGLLPDLPADVLTRAGLALMRGEDPAGVLEDAGAYGRHLTRRLGRAYVDLFLPPGATWFNPAGWTQRGDLCTQFGAGNRFLDFTAPSCDFNGRPSEIETHTNSFVGEWLCYLPHPPPVGPWAFFKADWGRPAGAPAGPIPGPTHRAIVDDGFFVSDPLPDPLPEVQYGYAEPLAYADAQVDTLLLLDAVADAIADPRLGQPRGATVSVAGFEGGRLTAPRPSPDRGRRRSKNRWTSRSRGVEGKLGRNHRVVNAMAFVDFYLVTEVQDFVDAIADNIPGAHNVGDVLGRPSVAAFVADIGAVVGAIATGRVQWSPWVALSPDGTSATWHNGAAWDFVANALQDVLYGRLSNRALRTPGGGGGFVSPDRATNAAGSGYFDPAVGGRDPISMATDWLAGYALGDVPLAIIRDVSVASPSTIDAHVPPVGRPDVVVDAIKATVGVDVTPPLSWRDPYKR